MKNIVATIALIVVFLTAASFTKSVEGFSRGKSELDQLYIKAKAEHRELAKFEEDFLNYQQQVNADRIKFAQKISARERLHRQAQSLISSIRNESIKKHVLTIQGSYYSQFNRLKQKQAGMVKPLNDELAISTDWFNAMKIAYALEQNRLIEREIEKELMDSEISVNRIKELNAQGQKIVTKMLSPAD